MTLLFDRKVELHVFLETEKYVIRDLHMSFDILATRDSKPNTAKIMVYNLSEATRNLFSRDTQGIEFWAGYGDELGMIFRGSWDEDTSIFKHYKDGPSWVTELETGDGLKEFQQTYFDKSYSQGAQISTILKDVANAMGLPVALDFITPATLNAGAVYSGKAKDVLDDLSNEYGFDWSIQHGSVEVVELGGTVFAETTAVLLSPDTGIVGRPVVDKDGLKVKTLMFANIKPTRLIQVNPATVATNLGNKEDAIKSGIKPNVNGLYRVDRIRYYGNNFGGDFNCDIESDLKA